MVVIVDEYLGDKVTMFAIMCHTPHFEYVTIMSSDEEFNQTIMILDTENSLLLHRLPAFDVNDELFQCKSSAFLSSESPPPFVFVNVRTETLPDNSQADIVKLNCFDLEKGKYRYRLNCGKKKFRSLLVREDRLAYICWQDGGFDMFDLVKGVYMRKIAPPEKRQVVCECAVTSSGLISFMTTTEEEADKQYSALWLWNSDQKKADIKQLVRLC